MQKFAVGTNVYKEDSKDPFQIEKQNEDGSYMVKQGTGEAKSAKSIDLRPNSWFETTTP